MLSEEFCVVGYEKHIQLLTPIRVVPREYKLQDAQWKSRSSSINDFCLSSVLQMCASGVENIASHSASQKCDINGHTTSIIS